MLRTWSIALAAMVAGPMSQAANATLSLACKGTATIRAAPPLEYKPRTDFDRPAHQLHVSDGPWDRAPGPYLFDDQLQITEWNEVTVIFRGFSQFLRMSISGSMDRMTGDVGMVATSKAEVVDYSLKCMPTQGRQSGYVEGQNVSIEYRWVLGQYDRLPALAEELVHRPISVLADDRWRASPALAAVAATKTIPIDQSFQIRTCPALTQCNGLCSGRFLCPR